MANPVSQLSAQWERTPNAISYLLSILISVTHAVKTSQKLTMVSAGPKKEWGYNYVVWQLHKWATPTCCGEYNCLTIPVAALLDLLLCAKVVLPIDYFQPITEYSGGNNADPLL